MPSSALLPPVGVHQPRNRPEAQTPELQSHLVRRLQLEKKKKTITAQRRNKNKVEEETLRYIIQCKQQNVKIFIMDDYCGVIVWFVCVYSLYVRCSDVVVSSFVYVRRYIISTIYVIAQTYVFAYMVGFV